MRKSFKQMNCNDNSLVVGIVLLALSFLLQG